MSKTKMPPDYDYDIDNVLMIGDDPFRPQYCDVCGSEPVIATIHDRRMEDGSPVDFAVCHHHMFDFSINELPAKYVKKMRKQFGVTFMTSGYFYDKKGKVVEDPDCEED